MITGVILIFASLTCARALTHGQIRRPVVRFIDFYIAAQKADVPKMKLWERIIYGLAIARTPDQASNPGLCDEILTGSSDQRF